MEWLSAEESGERPGAGQKDVRLLRSLSWICFLIVDWQEVWTMKASRHVDEHRAEFIPELLQDHLRRDVRWRVFFGRLLKSRREV